MKKVLLTGANGFIGRHCIPFLQNKGYEIFATYRERAPTQQEGIHWLHVDLMDSLQIKALLEKIQPTHLLHLAWYVAPGKFWASPDNLDWIKASLTLLDSFSKNSGKRVVMAGTCFEYDLSHSPFIEQSTLLKPATLYGGAKLSLGIALESFAKQMGLSAAWGRVFFLYGPHEYPQRFIPTIIKGLLRKEVIPCTHCEQVRDFLYVEDVAEGLVELLDSEAQGSYNIASGEGVTLKTIIQEIEDQMQVSGLVNFGAIVPQTFEPSHMIGDTAHLFKATQWRPRWNLKQGISKTIDWWKTITECSLKEKI